MGLASFNKSRREQTKAETKPADVKVEETPKEKPKKA